MGLVALHGFSRCDQRLRTTAFKWEGWSGMQRMELEAREVWSLMRSSRAPSAVSARVFGLLRPFKHVVYFKESEGGGC